MKKELKGFAMMLLGCAIIAFTFNAICAPHNYVTGGITAIGLLFNHLFGFKVSTVLIVGNIFVVILGILSLGFKEIYRSIIGSIVYTIFIYIFETYFSFIQIEFSSVFLDIVTVGVLLGIGCTLVYLANYTTGGVDLLGLILYKKAGISYGKGSFLMNFVILTVGAFVFGIESLVIALIIRYLEGLLIDKLFIGISDSKVLFINTTERKKVKELIVDKYESGISEVMVTAGFSRRNNKVIMCVVPTEKYLLLKNDIIDIDKDAFITILDAYEVYGGTNRYKLPFHDLRA